MASISLPNSFFCILAVLVVAGSGSGSVVEANKTKEKLTHLTFFWHDIFSGPAPTTATIVNSTNGTTLFGGVVMIDDPLTETNESRSKPLGRAQGFYAGASLTEPSFLMLMNFYITSGPYNGSTLSIMGRNSFLDVVSEMSVVGGTGKFRFARGYAQAQTNSFNNTTEDAVVKYDVYVMYSTPV